MPSDEPRRLAGAGQFRLSQLLVAVAIVAVLMAVLLQSPMPFSALLIAVLVAALGIQWDWKHNRTGSIGGAVGGCVGSLVVLAFHLVVLYTSDEPFEDEGLGLFEAFVVLSQYFALAGGAVGAFAWFIAYQIRVAWKNRYPQL